MTDEQLVAALRSRTKKVLSKNWLAGRECPKCGSEADRPKCMWDFGPNCPRLDPDNYSPPAWEYVPDKDCATAADRIEALTAKNELWRKALEFIALGSIIELDDEDVPVQVWLDDEDMRSIARAALEKKP